MSNDHNIRTCHELTIFITWVVLNSSKVRGHLSCILICPRCKKKFDNLAISVDLHLLLIVRVRFSNMGICKCFPRWYWVWKMPEYDL